MKLKLSIAVAAGVLLVTPGVAQAKTVHCGSAGSTNLSSITGKHIRPIQSRFGGREGGCYVADWVAYTALSWSAHKLREFPANQHATLVVAPRDAVRPERWHYDFHWLRRKDENSVRARCGRQRVTFVFLP